MGDPVDAAPVAAPRPDRPRHPASRSVSGAALALVVLPLLTVGLIGVRGTVTLGSVLLLYLLAVVVVAAFGSIPVALAAAVASDLLANYYFTQPLHTLAVRDQDAVIDLVAFVVVAGTVSITVDLAARGREAAGRSRAEAELLARLASQPVAESSLRGVLEQVRAAFAMTSVSLVRSTGEQTRPVATVGDPGSEVAISVEAGQGLRLEATGPRLFAADRRVLARLAAAAARAWETERLAEQAQHARVLADVDRLRTALLAAVGHDLRTPLARIKTAVTTLRQPKLPVAAAERAELLGTIDSSTDQLDGLIANLLALSRLQAGALSVHTEAVRVDEAAATAALHQPRPVQVDVPDDLPSALADPGLLERVLANLLGNAVRHSPHDRPVTVTGDTADGQVRLAITDQGPGVPDHQRDRMFAPFQRLNDRSDGGLGLGLAIAKGFTEAMGGTLQPAATPGGGLTMILTLPAAHTAGRQP